MRFNFCMHLLHQRFHFMDALMVLILETKQVASLDVAVASLSAFVLSFFFCFHCLDSLHSLSSLLLLQLDFFKLLFCQEVLQPSDVPAEAWSTVPLQHVIVIKSTELKCFLRTLKLLLIEPLRRTKRAQGTRWLLPSFNLVRVLLILFNMVEDQTLWYLSLLLLQSEITWSIPVFESLF